MKIDALGELAPDPKVPEWLVSTPVPIAYFDGRPVQVVLDGVLEDENPGEFEAAVTAFLALSPRDRELATEHVHRNYADLLEVIGKDDIDVVISEASAVWNHVHPTAIYVSRRHRRDRKVYVQISAECDWEQEHGLQIVYRDGRELSRVSNQDGHLTHTDAYDLPEDMDRIS